jgi:lysosomal acid lipase/cholesteryl ester hydrolase
MMEYVSRAGFLLADKGYDVWVGNNRGNGYSMKHIKYNTSDDQFWYQFCDCLLE